MPRRGEKREKCRAGNTPWSVWVSGREGEGVDEGKGVWSELRKNQICQVLKSSCRCCCCGVVNKIKITLNLAFKWRQRRGKCFPFVRCQAIKRHSGVATPGLCVCVCVCWVSLYNVTFKQKENACEMCWWLCWHVQRNETERNWKKLKERNKTTPKSQVVITMALKLWKAWTGTDFPPWEMTQMTDKQTGRQAASNVHKVVFP